VSSQVGEKENKLLTVEKTQGQLVGGETKGEIALFHTCLGAMGENRGKKTGRGG